MFAEPISLRSEYVSNHNKSVSYSLVGTSIVNLLKMLRTHGEDSVIPLVMIAVTPQRLSFLFLKKINPNEKNRITKSVAVMNERV